MHAGGSLWCFSLLIPNIFFHPFFLLGLFENRNLCANCILMSRGRNRGFFALDFTPNVWVMRYHSHIAAQLFVSSHLWSGWILLRGPVTYKFFASLRGRINPCGTKGRAQNWMR